MAQSPQAAAGSRPAKQRGVRLVASAVALIALLLVVAVAGDARRGSSAGAVRPLGIRVLADMVLAVLALIVVLGLSAWVMVLWSLRHRPPGGHQPVPLPAWWERLLAAGLPMVATMVVALVLVRSGALFEWLGPDGALEGLRLPGAPPARRTPVGGGSLVDWLMVTTIVVAVLAAVPLLALRARRSDRLVASRVPRPPHLGALRAVGLAELRREQDPRRAVIQAYGAMAAVLASWGLPRRPSETPFEFLERALVGLGASGHAARRLTELFEVARFSDHTITAASRAEAIDAVGSLQAAVPP